MHYAGDEAGETSDAEADSSKKKEEKKKMPELIVGENFDHDLKVGYFVLSRNSLPLSL